MIRLTPNLISNDIDNISTIEKLSNPSLKIGGITQGYAINLDGGVSTSALWSRTETFNWLNNAKALLYTCPMSNHVESQDKIASIAFYGENNVDSFISNIPVGYASTFGYIYKLVVVPENANYYRATLINGREDEYKIIAIGEKVKKEDFDKLENNFLEIIRNFHENLNIGSITKEYAINVNGGVSGSTLWSRTATFNSLNNAKALFYTRPNSNNPESANIIAAIAFYSSNTVDSFISSDPVGYSNIIGYTYEIVIVPENAKYYRATLIKGREDEYEIIKLINITNITNELENLKNDKDDLFTIEKLSNSSLEIGSITKEYAINLDGGVNGSTLWSRTATFNSLNNAKALLYTCPMSNNAESQTVIASIAFYISNTADSFISSIPVGYSNTIGYIDKLVIVPENAKYYRATLIKGREDEYKIITIGEKVKKENFDKLENNFLTITNNSHENLEIGGITQGYAINVNGGVNGSALWSRTATFNSLNNAKVLLYTRPNSNNPDSANIIAAIAFYSSNNPESFISSDPVGYSNIIGYTYEIVVVPENANYYRATLINGREDEYEIKAVYNNEKNEITLLSLIPSDSGPSIKTVEFPILKTGFYGVKSTKLFGHDLNVYLHTNDGWKQTSIINVKTGKESLTEYQHGEYFIPDNKDADRIRIVSNMSTINSINLSVVQYPSLPYVFNRQFQTFPFEKLNNPQKINFKGCFGVYNGYAYGVDNDTIKIMNLQSKEIETLYTHTIRISFGMVFNNGYVVFTEASNSNNKMYLLKDGTVTEKHDFYNEEHSIRLTPNRLFSYHEQGPIGIVGEYYGSKQPISGYKAFCTKDYGETWKTIFDLSSLIDDPVSNGVHLHSVVYDKYGDMYWACSGDTVAVNMIWYSLDGDQWYKIQQPFISGKPTEIVPTRDRVLFLSDMGQVNIYKWERKPIIPGDDIWLDTIKMIVHVWQNVCPIGAKAFYDEKTNLTYFGFYTDASANEGYSGNDLKYSDVFVTDGVRVERVYVDTEVIGLIGVYGNEDYIVVSRSDDCVLISRE